MDIDHPEPDERPPQLRRGTNQSGVRLYNERLVLSLIRSHGALAKANIARLTGLSPPTVQAIVQQLEADGLLLRHAAQRGRVGQPSVPLSLNPDGAFSFGASSWRRSTASTTSTAGSAASAPGRAAASVCWSTTW